MFLLKNVLFCMLQGRSVGQKLVTRYWCESWLVWPSFILTLIGALCTKVLETYLKPVKILIMNIFCFDSRSISVKLYVNYPEGNLREIWAGRIISYATCRLYHSVSIWLTGSWIGRYYLVHFTKFLATNFIYFYCDVKMGVNTMEWVEFKSESFVMIAQRRN